MIDILPFVGDQNLVSNDQGAYHDHGSEFSVSLVGPKTGPAGYTIYYTTSIRVDNTDLATFDVDN